MNTTRRGRTPPLEVLALEDRRLLNASPLLSGLNQLLPVSQPALASLSLSVSLPGLATVQTNLNVGGNPSLSVQAVASLGSQPLLDLNTTVSLASEGLTAAVSLTPPLVSALALDTNVSLGNGVSVEAAVGGPNSDMVVGVTVEVTPPVLPPVLPPVVNVPGLPPALPPVTTNPLPGPTTPPAPPVSGPPALPPGDGPAAPPITPPLGTPGTFPLPGEQPTTRPTDTVRALPGAGLFEEEDTTDAPITDDVASANEVAVAIVLQSILTNLLTTPPAINGSATDLPTQVGPPVVVAGAVPGQGTESTTQGLTVAPAEAVAPPTPTPEGVGLVTDLVQTDPADVVFIEASMMPPTASTFWQPYFALLALGLAMLPTLHARHRRRKRRALPTPEGLPV